MMMPEVDDIYGGDEVIHETCSCGAQLQYGGGRAREVAADWRETHKHAESVGICGDRPAPLILGATEVHRPPCVLKAGHAGMHADEEGSHWRYDDAELASRREHRPTEAEEAERA